MNLACGHASVERLLSRRKMKEGNPKIPNLFHNLKVLTYVCDVYGHQGRARETGPDDNVVDQQPSFGAVDHQIEKLTPLGYSNISWRSEGVEARRTKSPT